MLKDITLGQYFPGRSIIHRLDPRIKLITMIVYIVALFLAGGVVSYALSAGFVAVAIAVSGIKPKLILKSLKAIIFIVLFTAVLNLFWTTGETLLFSWWRIRIFEEGIYSAVFMVVRIMVLVLSTGLFLTYTTTPIALTDGIESLLAPLRVIRVPVHEFAMMMTIALRFIPTLSEETAKIMNAQKARGVDFSQGGLIRRAKALVPILIPLFVSSFRRADELAMAMECRCYRGGKGRTRMTIPHLHARDFAALLLLVAFGAGIVYLNYLKIGYTM